MRVPQPCRPKRGTGLARGLERQTAAADPGPSGRYPALVASGLPLEGPPESGGARMIPGFHT
jgi:hypothetical protein